MDQDFNLEGLKGLITSDKVLTLEEEARERFWRPTTVPRSLPTTPQELSPRKDFIRQEEAGEIGQIVIQPPSPHQPAMQVKPQQQQPPQVKSPQTPISQVVKPPPPPIPQVKPPQPPPPQVKPPQPPPHQVTQQKVSREPAPQAAVKAKSSGAPSRERSRLLSSPNSALIFNNIVMSLRYDRQGGVYIIANRQEKAAAIIETFYGRPDAARIVPLADIDLDRFFAQLMLVLGEGKLKNGILVIDAGTCSEAKLRRFIERISVSLPRLVEGLVHLLVWVVDQQLVVAQDLLADAAADRVKFYQFVPSSRGYS